jgi:hypothetical protein
MERQNAETETAGREIQDEPPPFLGKWPRVYKAVLCYLLLLIAGLYALTRFFRY